MSNPRVIALDLDDVLCQTNQAVADWHNAHYGTNMTLEDFHYYHYWKNPYWGTPLETHEKVKEYYRVAVNTPKPIDGALDGLKTLRSLGYRLVIVTARHQTEQKATQEWVDAYYPGLIDEIVCTGQFLKDEDEGQIQVKLGKPEVCHRIGARLLVDDSAENTIACARDATPPIPVLLFGNYSWNKRISSIDKPEDHLGYKQRLEYEHGEEWWKKEDVDKILPANVKRAKDWKEVVAYIETLED